MTFVAAVVAASRLTMVSQSAPSVRYALYVLPGLGAAGAGASLIMSRTSGPYLTLSAAGLIVAAEAAFSRAQTVDLIFRASAVGGGIMLVGAGVPVVRTATDGSFTDAIMNGTLAGGVALVSLGVAVAGAGLGTLWELLAGHEYVGYLRIIELGGITLAGLALADLISDQLASGFAFLGFAAAMLVTSVSWEFHYLGTALTEQFPTSPRAIIEDLDSKLEPIGALEPPGWFTILVGSSRAIAAVTTFLFVGFLYSGFGLHRLYASLVVSPVVNSLVALGATMAAIALMRQFAARSNQPERTKALIEPLRVMALLIAANAAILAIEAGLLYGMARAVVWIRDQGIWTRVLGLIVVIGVGEFAVRRILRVSADLFALLWPAVRCWFGAARAHPALPALCLMVFAVVQAAFGTWAHATGRVDPAIPTSVTLAISPGGPICLAVLAAIEMRLVPPHHHR